jgi:hypothetical protein
VFFKVTLDQKQESIDLQGGTSRCCCHLEGGFLKRSGSMLSSDPVVVIVALSGLVVAIAKVIGVPMSRKHSHPTNMLAIVKAVAVIMPSVVVIIKLIIYAKTGIDGSILI